ncbi:FkbM family methyltransferase [Leptolyngbya sp. 'hensonii']|uniref:FkbM family methyltransferase n=1 Tax=Leptolyngbya sp. 'hensonii' TaxID=1922337 RepID=UPI00094FB9F3|nr:FkbM family methyltransferase [Leptolyngbya sp. 'hensonii']OLP15493.1 FkbM family methyltransferase [Leptolyngbya sp. 'hensonii']
MSLIVQTLQAHQRLEKTQFTVAIIGSRKLSATEGNQWETLAPNLTLYGFDADAAACDAANALIEEQSISWTEKHYPLALSGQIETTTIHVTKAVHCSSLYAPNQAYLSRFHGIGQGLELDFKADIQTTTLDHFCQSEQIQTIDFLQVDVQGADFDVLQGALNLLQKSILGIQIEVEFSLLYHNQSLFSDIDPWLRNLGFTLFDLLTDDLWCYRPRACSPIQSATRRGQLLWADACYLRDPIGENSHPVSQNPEHILKLSCIADILGYPDYALELLEYLTVNHGKDLRFNFAHEMIAILSQFPTLVEQGLDHLPIVQSIRPFLTP